MPKFTKLPHAKQGWAHELLMSVVATSISIVLTFGYKGEIRDLKAASAKIDYDNSGTWVSLAGDLPILEGDPSIKEKTVTELSVMLKESLPRGRYRIHVSLSDSREAKLLVGSDDQLEIVAEFTVK